METGVMLVFYSCGVVIAFLIGAVIGHRQGYSGQRDWTKFYRDEYESQKKKIASLESKIKAIDEILDA